jgi:hypothetical protein
MPIAPCPILTSFAERTGKWRASMEDGSTQDFESEDAARAAKWSSLAPLYRLGDGREFASSELPPGSVYDVTDWGYIQGPDGRSINVVCPDGHHWSPDSRASNCTMKDDNVHRCWCRHGDPRATGGLHVDKVGNTCAAGAGSIQTSDWHGFLHNGYLVENDGQIPRPDPRHRVPLSSAHQMLEFAQATPPAVYPQNPAGPDRRDPRRIGGWGS